MKFLFSRDLRDQPHIRLSLIFFIVAMCCFWALNWIYEASSFGLYPKEILLLVLGNEESFAPPMTAEVLLLNVHVRLFLYTITLLTLASIYFRLPIKPQTQITTISVAYTLVLLNMLGVILLRFLSPSLVWLKFISFWGFQLVLGWMLFQSLLFLLSPHKKAHHHVPH